MNFAYAHCVRIDHDIVLAHIGMVTNMVCISDHIMEGRRCSTIQLRECVTTDDTRPFIDSCIHNVRTTITMPILTNVVS